MCVYGGSGEQSFQRQGKHERSHTYAEGGIPHGKTMKKAKESVFH